MFDFIRLRWVDLADVLLVALVVYYFLRFLKGTRAIRMVYALVLLVIVSFAARWFEFRALGLIISSLTTVWIVAFVIIFQPEVRNLLARFGRYRPFRFLLKHDSTEGLVEELVEAAAQLKSRRLGGLVAIERQIGLREFADTGTRVEARVSAALLVSIFTPPSPLHDGAVVISGGQLAAAACTLPLSEVTYQQGFLGMRHRAALGVSGQTDAVAVVVSETSGRISFANRGKLLTDLTPSQLKFNISQALLKET